jgi:4-carboxymuconolactone decarboxylase
MTGRLQRGKSGFDTIYGPGNADHLIGQFKGPAKDLVQYALAYEFGDVYRRPVLDLRSREISALSALTTIGGFDNELVGHTKAALAAGMTGAEILEVIINTAQFAGFTRGLHAVKVVADALDSMGVELPAAYTDDEINGE